MGVLALPPEAFVTLQEGDAEPHGARAVIGAGTGLGQAVLFWDGNRYRPHATEGGHAGFAPQGELQRELGAYLEKSHRPVSVERAVSGPGLLRIYRFLVERGVSTWPEVTEAIVREDPGEVIARHALARTDIACEQALDLFVGRLRRGGGQHGPADHGHRGRVRRGRDRAQDPAQAAGRRFPRSVSEQGPHA